MPSASSGVSPREVRSFCRFCAGLCGIVVTVDGDRVLQVRGDPGHPISRGYVCSKGRALGAFTHAEARLDHPLLGRGAARAQVSWDDCLDDLGARIRAAVDEGGPGAVGAYLGVASAFDFAGRRAMELFLQAIGSGSKFTSTTNDCPCKPYVGELMAGMGVIPVLDEAAVGMTVLIGVNPVVSHGHTLGFPDPVRRLRELGSGGREVWVLDPRTTETAQLATRHLRLRPGSDHAVLAFAIRELLGSGGADTDYLAAHAEGLDRLTAAVEPFDRARAAALTGLPPDDLDELVAAIRRHGRLGVQSGTGATMARGANCTEWLSRALEVVTGSADRPGGTLFNPGFAAGLDRLGDLPTPITTIGPGPASRPELSSYMGELPVSTATDEIEAGNLRVLLVLGGNPVTSFPETERLTAALAELDVLAVADVLHTDTTALATHVLPCAGPLERADLPYIEMLYPVVATQYTPAAVPAPFERRPAWWVLAALAERLGTSILPAGLTADTATDDDVLALQFASGPRSFAEARDAAGCVVAGPAPPGWVIDHVLPGGRWNVAPEPLVEQLRTLPDPPELALVARRQPRHMNSQLRDIAAPGGRLDRAEILVHPDQAAEHGIEDGDLIRVTSAHGSLQGRATLDPAVRPGVVSVPHGWAEPLGPNVSRLTSGTADVDPLTGMILQTGLAVTIDPAVAPVERQTVAGR